MKNAEWIIKTGHNFKQLRLIQHNELANRTYTVMLCNEPIAELNDKKEPLDVFRKWLDAEHKEPILNETERRYLSTVLGPVRNNVSAICKVCSAYEGREYIAVLGFFGGGNCSFLPDFEPGTMFKGMEDDKWYSLEELGL